MAPSQLPHAFQPKWCSSSPAFGIAPPLPRDSGGTVNVGLGIRCPHCGSLHTRQLSRFGSTSCKALYVCQRCQEPFDYFKAH